MRLFVAIDLPKEVKDYLYNLQKGIGSQNAKIKWVDKKNLHLTLKFLGEVDETKIENLKQKLECINVNGFEAKLSKIGAFPNESKINVVWAGVEPEDKVIELQKLVDVETLDFGDLKLGSHITLGRVKLVKNKDKFKSKLREIKLKDLTFSVGSFCLFRSVLSKDGPTYSLVRRYGFN